jgi:hypothetical protein
MVFTGLIWEKGMRGMKPAMMATSPMTTNAPPTVSSVAAVMEFSLLSSEKPAMMATMWRRMPARILVYLRPAATD